VEGGVCRGGDGGPGVVTTYIVAYTCWMAFFVSTAAHMCTCTPTFVAHLVGVGGGRL
jgi:hypothetical protein